MSSKETTAAVFETAYETQAIQQPQRSYAAADLQLEWVYKEKPIYEAVKRAFDIVFSIIGIVLTSPIMLATAIAIKIEDDGPAIHTRVCEGKNSRKYKMYKFRSMVVDADDLNCWLTPEQLKTYLTECKLEDDPRITRIGRFIRKTSLDELPQLLSVLKGDMSLIGPRPVVDSEMKNYSRNNAQLLFTAKPGITGYWQINGRSNSTYESGERQEMELYYVKNRCLALDMQILFRTVSVVLNGKGAK